MCGDVHAPFFANLHRVGNLKVEKSTHTFNANRIFSLAYRKNRDFDIQANDNGGTDFTDSINNLINAGIGQAKKPVGQGSEGFDFDNPIGNFLPVLQTHNVQGSFSQEPYIGLQINK